MPMYFLTDEDLATLKEFKTFMKNLRRTGAKFLEDVDYQTPEVYVANATETISALSAGTELGTGSVALLDDIPGTGLANVYQITNTGTLIPIGIDRIVFNLGSSTILQGSWLIIQKDKFGAWICEKNLSTTDAVDGTGTGTGIAPEIPTNFTLLTIDFLTKVCPPESGTSVSNVYEHQTVEVLGRVISTYCTTEATDCCPTEAPTVIVPCCPDNPIGETVYATITNKTGDCTCLPDSVAINYDTGSPTYSWTYSGWLGCTGYISFGLFLECVATPEYAFSLQAAGYGATLVSVSCDPFELVFDLTVNNGSDGICTGSFRVTITN